MRALLYGVIVALLPVVSYAQDMSGQWQGMLKLPQIERRLLLQIQQAPDGSLTGTLHDLEPVTRQAPMSALSFRDGTLRFTLAPPVKYEGRLSADGQFVTGTLMQGTQPRPLNFARASGASAWVLDASPHKISSVSVGNGVSLEVLDWGGSGPPLVFLAGLGGTAHNFDKLALRFTATHRVYAITRRGYGASSKPEPSAANYSASRLGDDVAAAIDALKLDRPVLAGHSLAGEELSAVANRHPDKVAGLIYLDAAYAYAFYTPGTEIPRGIGLKLQSKAVMADLLGFENHPTSAGLDKLVTGLADLQKDAAGLEAAFRALPPPPPDLPARPDTEQARVGNAITNNVEKYTSIPVPVLAIFAGQPVPPASAPPQALAAREAKIKATQKQMEAFRAAMPPTARIVWLPQAAHAVWTTHEEEVVRAMSAFMATPK
jgi:pimeloyl-ACP methyl ester carboxylesterase